MDQTGLVRAPARGGPRPPVSVPSDWHDGWVAQPVDVEHGLLMSPRSDSPDRRVDVLLLLMAAFGAAAVYVGALLLEVHPPRGLIVAFFAAPPICATFAVFILGSRARADRDPRLAWVSAGVAVGVVAMAPPAGLLPRGRAGRRLLRHRRPVERGPVPGLPPLLRRRRRCRGARGAGPLAGAGRRRGLGAGVPARHRRDPAPGASPCPHRVHRAAHRRGAGPRRPRRCRDGGVGAPRRPLRRAAARLGRGGTVAVGLRLAAQRDRRRTVRRRVVGEPLAARGDLPRPCLRRARCRARTAARRRVLQRGGARPPRVPAARLAGGDLRAALLRRGVLPLR